MPGCPYRNFEECPEHNKKGGCCFWISYTSKSGVTDAQMEGCAVTLAPMLLLENANALGLVAGEVNKVGAEVSAGRVENVKEGDALRKQLVCLSSGERGLVVPEHHTGIENVQKPVPVES